MIRPVDALAPKVNFRGQSGNYGSSANKEMEKKLAIINAFGISAVTGAVTTAISRGAVSSWKTASGIGVVTGALAMMFLAPFFLYKAGITSLSKEKDSDTFVKEKSTQKKMVSDINGTVDAKTGGITTKVSKTIMKRVA